MSARHPILLLLVLLLPAGVAVFGAGPAPEEGEAARTRRFRVEVWQTRPAPGADAAPLSLEALGLTASEAVRPVAARPRAAGWIDAAVTSPELFAAVAARPGAKAVFRFETECGAGEEAHAQVSREIPLTQVDVRGDQEIRTTRIQRVGASLLLSPLPGREDGAYGMQIEIQAPSATVPNVGAQVFSAQSRGTLAIADGTTAIFAFTDRVDGATRRADQDQVVEYLYLITRLDFGD